MLGVIVNVVTVLIGCGVGLIFRKGIPVRLTQAAMVAIGLCNLCMGVSGMLQGKNAVILILSMVIGTMIGTALNLDGRLSALSEKATKNTEAEAHHNPVSGFITASLIFCVGSMTILGGLNAGLHGDHTLYFTKALLDFITATVLSATLGFGVLFASLTVLIYQGALVILAGVLAPFLTETMIAELNCVGSVMIFALGLNLAGVSKFKVADFLPAIVVTPVICWLASYLG